jgi:hypothetical protein
LYVDDTIVVTVTPSGGSPQANAPPLVISEIQNVTIQAGDPPLDSYRDLNEVFADPEDGNRLTFTIASNSDTSIVTATIDADSALNLGYGEGQSGVVTIVIQATDSGELSVEDTLLVTVNGRPTSVPDPILPERYALHQNAPNPFNPTTIIGFDMLDSGPVRLSVFDVSGRLVRTLVDERMPAARHQILWDGRDDRGLSVASGVYLYRLETRSFRATKKMILLK